MHYSATEMAKKLDISRSYLYYLKKNNVVEIQENEQGHPIWNDAVYEKLYHYIRKNHIKNKIRTQKPEYKTTKINNRRYLGNKYKLLPFITRIVDKECTGISTVADIFADAINRIHEGISVSKLFDIEINS